MSRVDDSLPPHTYLDDVDAEDEEGEELEAMIEQADRAFASESFGTTALEQEEGESLDERLAEERPSRPPVEFGLLLEADAVPDEEKQIVGEASFEHDPFVAPEEAAMTIRTRAPGAVDHPEASVEPVDGPYDEDEWDDQD